MNTEFARQTLLAQGWVTPTDPVLVAYIVPGFAKEMLFGFAAIGEFSRYILALTGNGLIVMPVSVIGKEVKLQQASTIAINQITTVQISYGNPNYYRLTFWFGNQVLADFQVSMLELSKSKNMLDNLRTLVNAFPNQGVELLANKEIGRFNIKMTLLVVFLIVSAIGLIVFGVLTSSAQAYATAVGCVVLSIGLLIYFAWLKRR